MPSEAPTASLGTVPLAEFEGTTELVESPALEEEPNARFSNSPEDVNSSSDSTPSFSDTEAADRGPATGASPDHAATTDNIVNPREREQAEREPSSVQPPPESASAGVADLFEQLLESTAEFDAEPDVFSDVSDNSDLFHVEVDPHKHFTTCEDGDLRRIKDLSKHLREYPLMPPTPTAEDYQDVQSGARMPTCHCAFKGCTAYTMRCFDSEHWGQEKWLQEHLLAVHATKELREIVTECCSTEADTQEMTLLAYYMAAVREKGARTHAADRSECRSQKYGVCPPSFAQ